jgi:acyl phosphate:glycerol-3-phosphate acyltransferase
VAVDRAGVAAGLDPGAGDDGLCDAGLERMWFAVVIGLFLAWTHRANLVRLWHGTESRFERARLLYRLYGRSRY